jgi:hypothetical protein
MFRHVRVKTRDAHKRPGDPVWFEIEGSGLAIEQIMGRWSEAYRDPSFFPSEYYKVEASDRKHYLLRYSTLFKSWGARQVR